MNFSFIHSLIRRRLRFGHSNSIIECWFKILFFFKSVCVIAHTSSYGMIYFENKSSIVHLFSTKTYIIDREFPLLAFEWPLRELCERHTDISSCRVIWFLLRTLSINIWTRHACIVRHVEQSVTQWCYYYSELISEIHLFTRNISMSRTID